MTSASRPAPMRRRFDELSRAARFVPMLCTVCGRPSIAWFRSDNVRETGVCLRCRATNRQRQLALVACGVQSGRPRSLATLSRRHDLRVYNTEAAGPVHRALRSMPHYACSEYISPETPGGSIVAGVRHEDLQALSYPESSFDLVLSSDVFEHVPDPYRAHAEVLRVLRPGGHHVFTVPYRHDVVDDDVRAHNDDDGNVVHHAEPEYHLDPVHPDGALVYTIFGRGMADELRRLGFEVTVHRVHSPAHGIAGQNGFVFAARRPL